METEYQYHNDFHSNFIWDTNGIHDGKSTQRTWGEGFQPHQPYSLTERNCLGKIIITSHRCNRCSYEHSSDTTELFILYFEDGHTTEKGFLAK